MHTSLTCTEAMQKENQNILILSQVSIYPPYTRMDVKSEITDPIIAPVHVWIYMFSEETVYTNVLKLNQQHKTVCIAEAPNRT